MNRRARKREARRQEMLDVAIGIVERDGLEGLTIARLADALDAAVGALYRYFPGKDALLFAMQQQALQGFFVYLETLLAGMRDQLQAADLGDRPRLQAQLQLQLLMTAYLEDAKNSPARHRLIFEFMSSYEPTLDHEAAVEGEGAVMQLLGLVNQAATVLLGPDSSEIETWQATLMVWALVHGLDHFRKRDRLMPSHLHATTLLQVSQRNVFRGWGVPTEEVEEAQAWFTANYEALFTLPAPTEETPAEV